MKTLFLGLLVGFGFSHQVHASGCLNDSFYNLKAMAQSVGADYCEAEKLKKIQNPETMADRQYNYFAEKLNEYVMVLGPEAIDSASFEFMFYPAIRKTALANEDARHVGFNYTQAYNCRHQGETKTITSTVYVSGIVGLTGVCLTKTKIQW